MAVLSMVLAATVVAPDPISSVVISDEIEVKISVVVLWLPPIATVEETSTLGVLFSVVAPVVVDSAVVVLAAVAPVVLELAVVLLAVVTILVVVFTV